MAKHRLRSLLGAIIISFLIVPSVFAVKGKETLPDEFPVQIAVDKLPLYFSPYVTSSLDLQYLHLFFDPLVRWGKNRQIEKRLVKNWKTIKPGIIRFNLKENVKFHSDNQLQSDDVIWTFAQIPKGHQDGHCFDGIVSIKKIGQYSFDVYSRLSEDQILDYFTHFFVLDSVFYQTKEMTINKPQSIITSRDKALSISGTGPYKIKEYNNSLNLDVVRNEEYWQGKSAIKELNFIKINSAKSRTFALLADDIDISEAVSNKMLKTVNMVDTKLVVEVPSEEVVFLSINSNRTPIFSQKIIRKAINFAINKEGMLKHLINGKGRVASVYSILNQDKIALPVYDYVKARRVLGKVKVPLELTLLLTPNPIENITEITNSLVNMMKMMGIKLLITQASNEDVWNRDFFAYDLTLSSWRSPLMNSDNIYHGLFFDSILSHYFATIFKPFKMGSSLSKHIDAFNQLQLSYQITPLLFQNKIWATNKRYNLTDIFSVNGIPYWHLLAIN